MNFITLEITELANQLAKTLAGAQLPDSGRIEIGGEAVKLEFQKKQAFMVLGAFIMGSG